MAVLDETSDPERKPRLDTVGWIFVGLYVAVTGITAMAVYGW